MRQTFADEIVNRGFEINLSTVVFKGETTQLDGYMDDIFEVRCRPPFDYIFVHSVLTRDAECDNSQSVAGKINQGFYIQPDDETNDENAFMVIGFQFRDSQVSNTIGIWGRMYRYVFNDEGCLVKVLRRGFVQPTVDSIKLVEGFLPPVMNMNDELYYERAGFYIPLGFFKAIHNKSDFNLVTPSRQVSRQIERKTGKKPSPYFEIVVNPNKTQKRYTSTSKSGRKHNAHVVRGHFATYDDSAPLFGKYTGTFWRPSHVRGSGDQHVKPKDYRIVLPNNNQSASNTSN